ncbi:hypothetical protein GUJ93_ZPchr0011g27061 [Zizania palustris]|uniref:Uncharacterized protein n=1 Tax=Zizania palustris TaxID=103762 RepID=A0A8J6BSE2_ZIZPA|nr:hypothetical protein GUJ93_ZPchr0011g27061 [Zizania palustris]
MTSSVYAFWASSFKAHKCRPHHGHWSLARESGLRRPALDAVTVGQPSVRSATDRKLLPIAPLRQAYLACGRRTVQAGDSTVLAT